MLAIVTSGNIACGFHAGDPAGILRTLQEAARLGVAVGAHVGYPDLVGFGRRAMAIEPGDLTADCLYQIGALQALAHAAGTRVSYVKPHGALYNSMARDMRQADAVIAAIRALDPTLALLALSGAPVVARAREAGLRVICEVFADRAYLPDGSLAPRGQPGAVLHDPEAISARMLRLVETGRIAARDGSEIALEAQSICVHGDSPDAVAIAGRLRSDLLAAGITLAGFAP